MDNEGVSLENLIGFHTISRRHESFYAFVARLIRCNLLSEEEARKIIPRSWLREAFAPNYSCWQNALPTLSSYLEPGCSQDSKLQLRPWIPFPAFNSREPEYLRGCPTCFQHGYHSNAFQGDLLARCPVHSDPLIAHCPHCAIPLRWKDSRFGNKAFNAFVCPRGCSLLGALHEGLDSTIANAQAHLLECHLAHIELLGKAVHFVSGPIFITYPPRFANAAFETARLPSPGVFPAIIDALRRLAPEIPEFESHHEQSHGDWKVKIHRLPKSSSGKPASTVLEKMIQSFERRKYWTHLPLPSYVAPALLTKLGDHASVLGYADPPQLLLNSSFVTTYEVDALDGLLRMECYGSKGAYAHYEHLFHQILEQSLRRQRELQRPELSARHLGVAQSVSAIANLACGLVLISGCARAGQKNAREAWRDFSEPETYR